MVLVAAVPMGGVAEWLKAHAWKVCIRETVIAGSNPAPSARGFE